MPLPKMVRVKQHFPREIVADVRQAVQLELEEIKCTTIIKSGETVAIGAGSRGIANIDTAIKAVVDYLKDLGAKPFIFPAMGSHGGATAAGQKEVLHHYGISEETMQVPIQASMETTIMGETADGLPVFLDRYASEADHVVPVNRVKSHTDFNGSIESGIMKMLGIGVGKQRGANMYHRAFFRHGFEHVLMTAGGLLIESGKIGFAVALVENAYGETATVKAMTPDEIISTEQQLLIQSKEIAAKLPFDKLDLLVIDWMGKNISGTGMDTNVIGRYMQNFEPEPEKPAYLRILVCDLTSESGGNATGIGLADFTTGRLINKFNREATYMNCLTSLSPQKSRLPFHFDTDREALEVALDTIGLTQPQDAQTVRIEDTLKLGEIDISESLLESANLFPSLEILGNPKDFEFDGNSNLLPF